MEIFKTQCPKSKVKLRLAILIVYAFMFLSPFAALVACIPIIIWLFIMLNKVKHEEWKASGKQVSYRWFHFGRKPIRWFGAGVISAALGFLFITIALYLMDKVMYDLTLLENISLRVIAGLFCIPFLLYIALGFWMIKFSFRNPHMQQFNVLEPGKIVISSQGIKERTLREFI